MIDSRYPELHYVGDMGFGSGGSSIPVPSYAEQMMRRVAKQVTARVAGVRCVYNSLHKTLGFYYRSPYDGFMAGPVALQVFRPNGDFIDLSHRVDYIVRMLHLGRVPRKLKDAMAKAEEQAEQQRQKDEFRRETDARLDLACEQLRYKKRGRRSLVVDGGKA